MSIEKRTPYPSMLSVFVISLILLYVKKSDSLHNPQFWAEDGSLFFVQSQKFGWSSIFITYAGYYHLVPRVISNISIPLFDIDIIPSIFNYTSWIVSSAVYAQLVTLRLDLPHKWLFAIIPLLMPHGGEVYLTITNIQWVMAPLLVGLSIQEPADSSKIIISDCVVALIVGLTGPFSIMLFPIFLFRAILYRSYRSERLLFAVVSLTVFIQLYGVVRGEFVDPVAPYNWGHFPLSILRNIFIPLYGFGVPTVLSATLSLIVTLCVVIAGWIGLPVSWRIRVGAMLIFALIALIAGAHRIGVGFGFSGPFSGAQRYYYLPCAMIGWSLFIVACKARHFWNVAGIVALVLCANATAQRFSSPKLENLDWRGHIQAIVREGDVPINPQGWTVHVVKDR